MKTLIIPDIHGRSVWKQMIEIESPDRVVFLGDYFDSWTIPGLYQIHNFKQIIEYKKSQKSEIILLIGNHDFHYFPEIGYNRTSGYQGGLAPNITPIINDNRQHLQIAYQMGEFLFTHAGVSSIFMDQVFGKDGWNIDNVAEELNELFKYKPKSFQFNGFDPYGDNKEQTPIWIRPRSLMSVNKKHPLKKKYIQIVGHTNVKHIDFEGKGTGGRYYFVDTLDNKDQEYLTIIDGVVVLNKL